VILEPGDISPLKKLEERLSFDSNGTKILSLSEIIKRTLR
jgi:hypothetical protein